jgi:geranylgeranyl transferase type-2 subunit alpha
MHGRKRAEYKHRFQDLQVAQGLAQKAQQWHALNAKALHERVSLLGLSTTTEASDDDTATARAATLQLLDKMLRVNPDPLHLWNHRRELLLQQQKSTSSSPDFCTTELKLTAVALEKNPKAYGAWFHRKWVLQQQLQKQHDSQDDSRLLLPNELLLTEQFLIRDERNFHCWNYRRFLVGLELCGGEGTMDGSWDVESSGGAVASTPPGPVVIGPQIVQHPTKQKCSNNSSNNKKANTNSILQREWDFTQTKIVQNFSNFSAFHHRSKLLLLVSTCTTTNGDSWSPVPSSNSSSNSIVEAIASNEWSLMENIMFTEPDDQTIWWYHRFVLDWVCQEKSNTEAESSWYKIWLQQQAETLQVLVEEAAAEESGGKWALLGYHLVLTRLVASADSNSEERDEWKTKIHSTLDQLIQIDPNRSQRYEAMKRRTI